MTDNTATVSNDPKDQMNTSDVQSNKRGSSQATSTQMTSNPQSGTLKSSSGETNQRSKAKSIGNYVLGIFFLK